MNEKNLIFKKRKLGELGLDLYFYNIRTLMIYEYEVLYQLKEGIFSTNRYPADHSSVWINADLYLTKGKNNSRTVVEAGCDIIKNNYNLKKILDTSTSFNRVMSIGRLSIVLENDIDDLLTILNEGVYEFMDELNSEEDYSDFMNKLLLNKCSHSSLIFTEEMLNEYINCEYTEEMMRDDMGMIQNTMRNTISLQY